MIMIYHNDMITTVLHKAWAIKIINSSSRNRCVSNSSSLNQYRNVWISWNWCGSFAFLQKHPSAICEPQHKIMIHLCKYSNTNIKTLKIRLLSESLCVHVLYSNCLLGSALRRRGGGVSPCRGFICNTTLIQVHLFPVNVLISRSHFISVYQPNHFSIVRNSNGRQIAFQPSQWHLYNIEWERERKKPTTYPHTNEMIYFLRDRCDNPIKAVPFYITPLTVACSYNSNGKDLSKS